MKLYIKKQWKRSNWLGFIRRIRERLIGRKCYMTECHGRLQLVGQFNVQGDIREFWVCEVCDADTEEIY